MGRWAQRKRGGGGITLTNVIIAAQILGLDEILVTFSQSVDDSQFALGDWNTNPSNTIPINIFQSEANSIVLAFPIDVDGESSLTYDGDVPNIQSPQTKTITT